MQLALEDGLLYASVAVGYRGATLIVPRVLVDTGSCSTLFSVDALGPLGITPQMDDCIHTVRGVGGTETVFTRRIGFLEVGDYRWEDCQVEVGGMDYGLAINGILGMDFLLAAGAIIDLRACRLDFLPVP